MSEELLKEMLAENQKAIDKAKEEAQENSWKDNVFESSNSHDEIVE